MKEQLKANLIAWLNSLEDTEELLEVFSRLNIPVSDEYLADSIVWGTIKELSEVEFLDQDNAASILSQPQISRYRSNTKEIKFLNTGEWYINKAFNLKLKPCWVNVIEEEEIE